MSVVGDSAPHGYSGSQGREQEKWPRTLLEPGLEGGDITSSYIPLARIQSHGAYRRPWEM